MDEIWLTCPDFPMYDVSNMGRIRRNTPERNTYVGRIMKQATIRGYQYITLCRDGKRIMRSVHRLVCRAFNGEPPADGMQTAHNDGDRKNNNASNLRWDTVKGNHADKHTHGTIAKGERNGNAKLTAQTVAEIRAFEPRRGLHAELSRTYGVTDVLISLIRKPDSKLWR